jgi:hypothetical protein
MVKSRVVVGGLFALSFLVACDRGSAHSGPACDKTAAQIITVMTKGKQDVHAMEVKSAIVKRCTDDKWSDEARTCIAKAQTRDELKTCAHDKLTGEQADHLKESSKGVGSSASEAMAKMQEFSDKMCACKEAKCAQDVSDEMTKWAQEMAKEEEEPPKMSEEDMKKATEIGQRMGECMMKAMGGDLPQQDPPPPRDEPDHIDKGADTGTPLKEGDKTPDGKIIVK